MAETIQQAFEAIDAVGDEHNVGDGAGTGMTAIVEMLGIDNEELREVAKATFEPAIATSAMLTAPAGLQAMWATVFKLGFVVGARWQGENRG